jgi:hypothetical protein
MKKRKDFPIYTGLLKYFPDALMEVARTSQVANDQHNPGEPLHWDRTKSVDQMDALMRHATDYARGDELDEDGCYHLSKVAWRALAQLQIDIEKNQH